MSVRSLCEGVAWSSIVGSGGLAEAGLRQGPGSVALAVSIGQENSEVRERLCQCYRPLCQLLNENVRQTRMSAKPTLESFSPLCAAAVLLYSPGICWMISSCRSTHWLPATCFCHLASQPFAFVLSKTFTVLKWSCPFSFQAAVVRRMCEEHFLQNS